VAVAQYTDSPELTGIWWCKGCGNSAEFVGHDDEGCPGEGNCDCEDTAECRCTVTLTQTVYILALATLEEVIARAVAAQLSGEDVPVGYSTHEGGGSGAEINGYTRVYCAECDALLWCQPGHEEQDA
jgi:hypothetical protein